MLVDEEGLVVGTIEILLEEAGLEVSVMVVLEGEGLGVSFMVISGEVGMNTRVALDEEEFVGVSRAEVRIFVSGGSTVEVCKSIDKLKITH